MNKKLLLALIVVAVGVAGYFIFLRPSGETTGTQNWIASPVTSGNISQSITATGTIEPVTSVDVGTQVSGIVTNIYVDYNHVVKKGQIIAELDKSTLEIEYNNNLNSLAEAEALLRYEESNYNRTKTLYESGLSSDSEYETDLYNYTKAKIDVDNAKNSVKKSKISLGYATIYSPIDGVVLSREVEEGQTVASSLSTPTLFCIAADLTDMEVIADIDEADIGGVKEGQRVSFTVDAYPGEEFKGEVVEVRQQATIESNVVTYEVVISAANPDLKLKPGLTASVEVFTVDVDSDQIVPASALVFDPESVGAVPARPEGAGMGQGGMGQGMGQGGMGMGQGMGMGMGQKSKATKPADAGVVWVLKSGEIRPVEVKIGLSNGVSTAVEGNLNPADSVVTGVSSTFVARTGTSTQSPFVQQRRR